MTPELRREVMSLCKRSYDQGVRDGILAAADMLETAKLATPVIVETVRLGARVIDDSPQSIWDEKLGREN